MEGVAHDAVMHEAASGHGSDASAVLYRLTNSDTRVIADAVSGSGCRTARYCTEAPLTAAEHAAVEGDLLAQEGAGSVRGLVQASMGEIVRNDGEAVWSCRVGLTVHKQSGALRAHRADACRVLHGVAGPFVDGEGDVDVVTGLVSHSGGPPQRRLIE